MMDEALGLGGDRVNMLKSPNTCRHTFPEKSQDASETQLNIQCFKTSTMFVLQL